MCVLRRCNRHHHHHHHHHHPSHCVFCEGAKVEARPEAGGQPDCLHLVSQHHLHHCHCYSPTPLFSLLMFKQLLHLNLRENHLFNNIQHQDTSSNFCRFLGRGRSHQGGLLKTISAVVPVICTAPFTSWKSILRPLGCNILQSDL